MIWLVKFHSWSTFLYMIKCLRNLLGSIVNSVHSAATMLYIQIKPLLIRLYVCAATVKVQSVVHCTVLYIDPYLLRFLNLETTHPPGTTVFCDHKHHSTVLYVRAFCLLLNCTVWSKKKSTISIRVFSEMLFIMKKRLPLPKIQYSTVRKILVLYCTVYSIGDSTNHHNIRFSPFPELLTVYIARFVRWSSIYLQAAPSCRLIQYTVRNRINEYSNGKYAHVFKCLLLQNQQIFWVILEVAGKLINRICS